MGSNADLARRRLIAAVSGAHAPHAVFIDCADTPLTTSIARSAAAQFCMGAPDERLLASCADYHEIDPDKEIKIDVIRDLIAELSRRAFDEGGRAVFLPNAHMMNANAQNALLKTLEEPPDRTLFLLSGNRSELLPTICSRCHTLHISVDSKEVAAYLSSLGASEREARLYAAQGGSMRRAERLYKDPDYRALRDTALDTLISFLGGKSAFQSTKVLGADMRASVDFMLDLLGDMVEYRHTGRIIACNDRTREISELTPRFTTGEINGIIVMMAEALGRYKRTRYAGTALDRLFSGLLTLTAGRST